MKQDKYLVEIWLRGHAKRYAREIRTKIDNSFSENLGLTKKLYPHITLIPPFSCDDEFRLLEVLEEQSQSIELLPFSLIGFNTFQSADSNYLYLKAKVDPRIDSYRYNLHCSLLDIISCVENIKKVEDHIHHVTIAQSMKYSFSNVPTWFNMNFKPIDQYMLRVTLLKNKEVYREYDFAQEKLLTRKEALLKSTWSKTMNYFSNTTGLKPSKNGFINID